MIKTKENRISFREKAPQCSFIKVGTLLIFLFTSVWAFGQQLPVFSNYAVSDMYRNPSSSLQSPFNDVQLFYSNSAPGYQGAPISYFLGYTHLITKKGYQGPSYQLSEQYQNSSKQAISGYLMYDRYGEMNQLSAMASYAQAFKINEDMSFALGLALGIYNYRIDYSSLNIKQLQDQTFYRYVNSQNSFTFFDANFGFTGRYKNYKLQFSWNQLMSDQALLTKTELNADFYSTTFASMSAMYSLSRDLDLVPELIFYNTGPLPSWIGLKGHFIYDKKYLGGLIYNVNRNVGLELGMIYDAFVFQYSFLVNTNTYNVIGFTNHNLGIRYSLNPNKNTNFKDYF
jgi:type IX secretion system PorP/SprF family membrane protein